MSTLTVSLKECSTKRIVHGGECPIRISEEFRRKGMEKLTQLQPSPDSKLDPDDLEDLASPRPLVGALGGPKRRRLAELRLCSSVDCGRQREIGRDGERGYALGFHGKAFREFIKDDKTSTVISPSATAEMRRRCWHLIWHESLRHSPVDMGR
jgi:hypothetical protein